jgi:hypothetical protein
MRKLMVAMCFFVCLSLPAMVMAQDADDAHKQPAKAAAKGGQKDPLLHDAMKHLETAKDLLQKNPREDYEGHRKEAIQSIDQAMHHVAQALEVHEGGTKK